MVAFSTTVMSEREFREKLAKMEQLNNDVSKHCTTLFSRCNRATSFLPPPLADQIIDALRKVNELNVKFFAEIEKIVLNPGWPFSLMSAGEDWTEKVGGPANQQLAPMLSEDQRRIDNYWKGPAAEQYAKILPSQQRALETIKAATDAIDSNLHKTAYGIFGLWIGITIPVVMYVFELASESAAAATIVAAPPAAAGAAASTAKAVGLVAAIIGAFVAYIGTVVDSLTSLRQTLHSMPEWPKATTSDFDDGSLSDGDTTDWRIDTHD